MNLWAILTFISLLTLGSSSRLSKIYIKDGNFVDEEGRIILFRGINSVIKRFPWYDPIMLDPERQKQLGDWGFNAIRLGAMWSGVEPTEGNINETYIGVLKDIVAGLQENGVYTYLDMHQDVLTNKATYDGIPSWLSSKFASPQHQYPWPMKDTSGFSTWACGYFSQEISNGFNQLYTQHKQEFGNVWKEIATRFKEMPEILGYELLNEPWTGDIFQDLSLLLPGNAGHQLLEPFFNAASDAIREVDDETLIFWEPVTYAYFVNTKPNIIVDTVLDSFLKSQNYTVFLPILNQVCGDIAEDAELNSNDPKIQKMFKKLASKLSLAQSFSSSTAGRPSVLGPGFSNPPGGAAYLNRTVMSYHYYCWALGYASDESIDPILTTVCDDVLGPMVFNTVQARATELGGSATMLTEFGECTPYFDHPDYQGSVECNFVLGEAEKHLQSWSYWDTANGGIFWDQDNNINYEAVKVFSRPYPQATAGTPVSLSYDLESRRMDFSFLPNLQIISGTEIFIPDIVYTDGFTVTMSPHLTWEHHPSQSNKIIVTAYREDMANITIVPK